MTLASGGGESDVPACGPPASFSVHLDSSAVTPAGSVHKSRGDNVVRMWVQLKRDYVSQLPCVRYYVFVKSSFKHAREECESKRAYVF